MTSTNIRTSVDIKLSNAKLRTSISRILYENVKTMGNENNNVVPSIIKKKYIFVLCAAN